MSEMIRINRQKRVSYSCFDSIQLTTEEYERLKEKVGDIREPLSAADAQKVDAAIEDLFGDEWEVDQTEPEDDKVVDIWIDEEE